MDKRQATAQRGGIRPVMVFRGKGLRITAQEHKQWDKRVVLKFQDYDWVDETTGLQWIQFTWRQTTFEPHY